MKNKNNNKNSCNGCHGDCVSDTSVGFKISENFKRFNQKNDIFSRSFWDDQIGYFYRIEHNRLKERKIAPPTFDFY